MATLTASDDTSEGHAFLTGDPVISPDISTEKRFVYAPFLIENGVKAIANVLIIGGQHRRPFGILKVDSRSPRRFTENDTAFLRSYANLIAATVERMRISVVTLVFGGQAVFSVARERQRMWSSRPGKWLILSSIVDLSIVSGLALSGVLMTALPAVVLGGLGAAAVVFALVLDAVKVAVFQRLAIA
ncbi:GAF domain-containing protein [Lichenihabitans psoromatis]|uniref:GAF domain-containing protein n=1 Tax=Lichenihabitans psoromatis TaxID=2528642 RepID=UPI001A94462D|nr:GAF domain-containing protein [Lichenihabitans psoromatis]